MSIENFLLDNDDDEFEEIEIDDEFDEIEADDELQGIKDIDSDDISDNFDSDDFEMEYSTITWGVTTKEFPDYEKVREESFKDDEDPEDDSFDNDFADDDNDNSILEISDESDSFVNDEMMIVSDDDSTEYISEDFGVSDEIDYQVPEEEIIDEENTIFEYEVESSEEFKEVCEETIKLIDDTKLLCRQVGDELLRSSFKKIDEDVRAADANSEKGSRSLAGKDGESSRIRTFNESKNVAVREEYVYTEPIDVEKTFMQRLLPYVIACVIVSGFVAVKCNSYCDYKIQNDVTVFEPPSLSKCLFGWVSVHDMPTVIYPFYPSVAFGAFGITLGISAVISWYFWSKSEQSLKSRVGHEHGNASLATIKDYKNYKKEFMED